MLAQFGVSQRGFKRRIAGAVMAGCAVLATGSAAVAGGLAVREQSALFQGTSFAGNAAGGALSSSFWNSAAMGEAGYGFSSDSNYSLILGRTEFTVLPGTTLGGVGSTTERDRPAIVGGSYGAYRISDKMVIGVAMNAPFGLGSEVDNPNWAGQYHHRSAKLITFNVNPMASIEIAKGLFLGVGLQGQYAKLTFKTAASTNGPTSALIGDDVGFGYTVGILWKPAAGTSIGLGFRSSIAHTVEGDQRVLGTPTLNRFALEIETPEMVTFSFRQALTERMRLLGTVEWTNWDRLTVHPVKLTNLGNVTVANFDFRYSDGWFFSLGGEYDYSRNLTFRTGIAYEISPVDDPTKRLPQVPDADRIWLSAGLTYKWSETTSINFGYTHIFLEDSTLSRRPAALAANALVLNAGVESSVDIISVGYTMKFGGGAPLK